jgi:hypothetical protein
MLQERIDGKKADLAAQIRRIQDRSAAEIAALQKQIAILNAVEGLITPQLEAALVKLQEIGLLTDLA